MQEQLPGVQGQDVAEGENPRLRLARKRLQQPGHSPHAPSTCSQMGSKKEVPRGNSEAGSQSPKQETHLFVLNLQSGQAGLQLLASLNQLTLDRLLGTELGSLPKESNTRSGRGHGSSGGSRVPLLLIKVLMFKLEASQFLCENKNPKAACVNLCQDQTAQGGNEKWDLFGKTRSLHRGPIPRLVPGGLCGSAKASAGPAQGAPAP